MRVCVIGTGYVGLVTGASLAHIGHHVICVDNNEAKVNLMKSGQSPIFEPGLSDVMTLPFKRVVWSSRLIWPQALSMAKSSTLPSAPQHCPTAKATLVMSKRLHAASVKA